jgi:hypothetical protein
MLEYTVLQDGGSSVEDGSLFYRLSSYVSILQLITRSSTHSPTVEVQHIGISLI